MIDFRTSMLLRILTDAVISAKGAQLTFAELDLNQQIIANTLARLEYNPVYGAEAYNAGFAYVGGTTYYVSYSGNIWKFISASSQTGVTPGSNALIWELSSIGAFAHLRGTDTQLMSSGGVVITGDQILTWLASGGPIIPPVVDPSLRLLTGGEYIYDPDFIDDTFHYLMLASTWVAADGSDKSIAVTPFVVVPAATGMVRLDVPCLAPGGTGTVIIVSGVESDTLLTYPTIPAGYIALQSIFVSDTESYPYPYNIPTKNRDGITGEIRNNSATFHSIDNLEALHGTTVRERFDIDYSLIAESDTVTKEEGIDSVTGEPRIILHAAGMSGGIADAPSDGTTYGRKNAGWVAVGTSAPAVYVNTFTATLAQTVFTLSHAVTTTLIVVVAGIVAASSDYTASGTTLTLAQGTFPGEEVRIIYL